MLSCAGQIMPCFVQETRNVIFCTKDTVSFCVQDAHNFMFITRDTIAACVPTIAACAQETLNVIPRAGDTQLLSHCQRRTQLRSLRKRHAMSVAVQKAHNVMLCTHDAQCHCLCKGRAMPLSAQEAHNVIPWNVTFCAGDTMSFSAQVTRNVIRFARSTRNAIAFTAGTM